MLPAMGLGPKQHQPLPAHRVVVCVEERLGGGPDEGIPGVRHQHDVAPGQAGSKVAQRLEPHAPGNLGELARLQAVQHQGLHLGAQLAGHPPHAQHGGVCQVFPGHKCDGVQSVGGRKGGRRRGRWARRRSHAQPGPACRPHTLVSMAHGAWARSQHAAPPHPAAGEAVCRTRVSPKLYSGQLYRGSSVLGTRHRRGRHACTWLAPVVLAQSPSFPPEALPSSMNQKPWRLNRASLPAWSVQTGCRNMTARRQGSAGRGRERQGCMSRGGWQEQDHMAGGRPPRPHQPSRKGLSGAPPARQPGRRTRPGKQRSWAGRRG